MKPADPVRRHALDRARAMVAGGARIADAARVVGLSVDVCKKASRAEGWRADVEPVARIEIPKAEGSKLSVQIEAEIRAAIATGRASPRDLIAAHEWSTAREREAAQAPDLGNATGAELAAIGALLARLEGREPEAEPYQDRLEQAQARAATLAAEVEALRTAQVAPDLQLAQERDALASEVVDLRGRLVVALAERDTEASRVRGLESLLAGPPDP